MAKKRSKKQKTSLIIIGILIIALSGLFITYLNNKDIFLTVDDNAIKDQDDNTDKMDVAPGGGAASLEYSNQVAIDKELKEISLYLKNPNKSRENISIEIYLTNNNEDLLVGKSDLIPTGYSINKVSLENVDINEGQYKGYIKVFFYNEETNEKEIIDSKIKVEIKVK